MQREFSVRGTCQEIVPIIVRELRAAGFRVEQSFDLRSALSLLPACTCPHHGTARCDCQYNVLLIYGQGPLLVSLIVHGHERQCWMTLADIPNGGEPSQRVAEIIQTLADAALFRLP